MGRKFKRWQLLRKPTPRERKIMTLPAVLRAIFLFFPSSRPAWNILEWTRMSIASGNAPLGNSLSVKPLFQKDLHVLRSKINARLHRRELRQSHNYTHELAFMYSFYFFSFFASSWRTEFQADNETDTKMRNDFYGKGMWTGGRVCVSLAHTLSLCVCFSFLFY